MATATMGSFIVHLCHHIPKGVDSTMQCTHGARQYHQPELSSSGRSQHLISIFDQLSFKHPFHKSPAAAAGVQTEGVGKF